MYRNALLRKKLLQPCIFCFQSKLNKSTISESWMSNERTTKLFGQPTFETHPHLLRRNEVTPMITRDEFRERRQNVMDSIITHLQEKNADPGAYLVVVSSATKQYMSNKIPYFFRQNTEFLYLTGCQEPDCCLVMSAVKKGDHKSVLFMQENDEHSEIWDGPVTGPDNARDIFGVDGGLPLNELEKYLDGFKKTFSHSSLWFDYLNPLQTVVHKVLCDYLGTLTDRSWESPKSFVHKQQLIKSPAEIALMKKSCEIASKAIEKAIEFSRPGINEYQLFAKVDYECRMNGAEFLAYPPVVAGGNRANIIHYIKNDHVINKGEMVLMDAGCEYHGYSSDITRTWPINGHFTSIQRDLYEAVLLVQLNLIEKCKERPTLDELFNSMCFYLGKYLQEIGVIHGGNSQELMRFAYKFCPHHVAHYLGMDVHDTPTQPRNINLQPGMIITIEPGIYINQTHTDVYPEFRGLGIRIEDDILITESGPVVLSHYCPKDVRDIEYFASKNVC